MKRNRTTLLGPVVVALAVVPLTAAPASAAVGGGCGAHTAPVGGYETPFRTYGDAGACVSLAGGRTVVADAYVTLSSVPRGCVVKVGLIGQSDADQLGPTFTASRSTPCQAGKRRHYPGPATPISPDADFYSASVNVLFGGVPAQPYPVGSPLLCHDSTRHDCQ